MVSNQPLKKVMDGQKHWAGGKEASQRKLKIFDRRSISNRTDSAWTRLINYQPDTDLP